MARSPYQHPLKHYVTVYGKSYRTILRWVEKGYPLDDVEATKACEAGQRSALAPHDLGNVPTLSLPPGEPGLAASIQRLRAAEVAAHKAFQEEANVATRIALQKQWLDLAEQLLKLEGSTPKIQETNKQTVKLNELTRELSELFRMLRQDLEALPAQLSISLVGKSESEIKESVSSEVEKIMSGLFSCKYLTPKEADRE